MKQWRKREKMRKRGMHSIGESISEKVSNEKVRFSWLLRSR